VQQRFVALMDLVETARPSRAVLRIGVVFSQFPQA